MMLPYDVCRCHADGCKAALRCRRWVERDQRGERTPHIADMREGKACLMRLPLAAVVPG